MTRDRWSVAIHYEDRREGSLISEKDFICFADVHATMKKNKGRRFVVRMSKTASTMEIQAMHNLRNLGYLVEAQFRSRTPSPPLAATLPEGGSGRPAPALRLGEVSTRLREPITTASA